MGKKQIGSVTTEKGDTYTATRTDGDSGVQLLTLGFAGQPSYGVEKNGERVSSASSRDDAINKMVERSRK